VNELNGKGCTTFDGVTGHVEVSGVGDGPDHAHLRDRNATSSSAER
jgi:hypothetical protein